VQILATQLFEVQPRDLVVFSLVPAAVLLAALLASWVPADRASRIEPLRALRYE
jgi:ABC-type lipoprotein release transport system permease subunit